MKAAIVTAAGSSTHFIEALYQGVIRVFDTQQMSLKSIVAAIKEEGIEKVGIDKNLDPTSKKYLQSKIKVPLTEEDIEVLEACSHQESRKTCLWITAKILNGQTNFSVVIKS